MAVGPKGSDQHREITMMGLHMLVLQGSHEHTTAHFAELWAAAHLELVATQPTRSDAVYESCFGSLTMTVERALMLDSRVGWEVRATRTR